MPKRLSHTLLLSALLALFLAPFFCQTALAAPLKAPESYGKGYRFERAHWIYVHLEGSPREIGLEHGHLLAPEIVDMLAAIKLEDTHSTGRDWKFFRSTAEHVLWPQIEDEYREELKGIAEGAQAEGAKVDLWDIVAMNGHSEVPDYYVPWLDKHEQRKNAPTLKAPGNCSAFVATGSWTADHKPVIAHNNWTSFVVGERWRVMLDIVPTHGERILMDAYAGAIASGDDFGINGAQIAITETTITGYSLFDPAGVPEFVRARKAMQYSRSIDDYVRIFLDRNNGGYANDWLLADYKTGEVARFEVGLKMHKLWRTTDGYFAGANFPSDPEFIKAETDFDPNNKSSSPNARHIRWDALLPQYKGKLDSALAEQMMGDHFDAFENKSAANERSLCGHVHESPRGVPEWEWAAFNPAGTVNSKAADGASVARFALSARSGLGCGQDFIASKFLAAHPEFNWLKPTLRDMPGNPWSEFAAGQKQ